MNRSEKIALLKAIAEGRKGLNDLEPRAPLIWEETDTPGLYLEAVSGCRYTREQVHELYSKPMHGVLTIDWSDLEY